MRKTRINIGVGFIVCVFAVCALLPTVRVRADAAPQLRLSEVNITGDEFVVIENAGTAPADLSQYWLGYNSSDVTTALPSQQLSAQSLEAGEALVLNNGAVATCGAAELDALSFSLSNTAGKIDLWQLTSSSTSADYSFIDGVSWGKSATSTNYLHIADEANVAKHNAINPNASWYKADDVNDQAQNWQVGDLQNCAFTPITSATSTADSEPMNWDTDGDDIPFTVEATASVGASSITAGSIPAIDLGLKPVELSEILPNPASPQTDADDEFIELYNPNTASFDLSGFKLQIGSVTSTTTHTYTIPNGTMLGAKGFKAFMSSDTGLSMNNSGGQVWLLDPLGATIGQSDTYGTAKDGYVWIHTNGKWQWSTQATPNKTNILAAPASTGSNSTKTATVNGKTVAAIKGASTASASGSDSSGSAADAAQVAPIHPWTLALVAGAAILYGAYEYRHDVANRVYQFRSNRAARRAARG